MKKYLSLSFLFLLVPFLMGARVSEGVLSQRVLYTYFGTQNNANSSNILIGQLPPRAAIVEVKAVMKTAFDSTTNNLLVVRTIWSSTNVYVSGHTLARTDSPLAVLTNAQLIESSNRAVPVYYYFTNSGATTNAAGEGYVIVRYVQF